MEAEIDRQKIVTKILLPLALHFVFLITHILHFNLLDCCMMVELYAGSRRLKEDKVQFSAVNG